TFDRSNPRDLTWTADNKAVLFLANRKREAEKAPPWDGKTQVWRATLGGGIAPLTQVAGGVEAFALTGDGRYLFYLVHSDSTQVTSSPDQCYRKHAAPAYAWIEHVAIAPDGKTVAFNAIWDGYPCEIVLGHWKDGDWTSHLMRRPKTMSVHGYGSPLTFVSNK